MGHPVPSPTTVLVGELLPPVDKTKEVHWPGFEYNRAYEEVSAERSGDPLDNSKLLSVIMDPWSSIKLIPKKYTDRALRPGSDKSSQEFHLPVRRN